MNTFDAIIWDIDGTLLDTAEGLVAAYRYCSKVLQLPQRSDAELKSYIGPVPQDIFRLKYGMDQLSAQYAADIFRSWYKQNGLRMAYLYEGIMEVLAMVPVKQAIATNKRQDYAQEICDIFGISQHCYPILGADNESGSTKATLIRRCVQALGATQAVMIGDTEGDLKAAKDAEVAFLGVNYGYGFHGVEGYVNNVKDFIKLFI